MAIFSRNGKSSDTSFSAKGMTTIARGTTFIGDIETTSNIHIDGLVKGNINSDAVITIGERGQMEGNIIAEKVIISGTFTGNINAEYVELIAKSTMKGEIINTKLVIEEGADFEGISRKRIIDLDAQKEISLTEKKEKTVLEEKTAENIKK